ncbi:helix-turn-helix domain-containing protein [Salinibacter ruber]|uniref:helix-turn-helix domain-containing protein n=1 Tax=Salinibacter ruber TaxID=146919 RepID=UPI002169A424|nr:helix-turn-helix domain-containing protein [Salinibacter ruber]MCS4195928.1 excisionase family DNA binding protein [Salinibacter ruber]
MVANTDEPDNLKGGLQNELCSLVQGLREEVQALQDEVTALRRKEAPEGPDALLPREEAAEMLGISVRTLDDMEEAGEIQAVRIRGRVLYAPETLEAYIRRRAGEGRK